MAGILLGLEDEIPPKVQDAFRRTGTSHIIAISGFNITILASLLTWFAVRLIRRVWAPLLAAGLIAVYTLLVGADPPVVRAAIMGTVALLGGVMARFRADQPGIFGSGHGPISPSDCGRN